MDRDHKYPHLSTLTEGCLGKPNDPVTNICQAADKQLFTLVEWAKRIPHSQSCPSTTRSSCYEQDWNELLIASFSHRSISVKDGILLATGLHVAPEQRTQRRQLVSKMRDMQMDKTELGCLRAIVLFNPGNTSETHTALPPRPYRTSSDMAFKGHRFAKLLLRLPALRSIGLKCLEHLVLTELVSKMRDMQMDKTELGCLRAIVLFNPGWNELLIASFSHRSISVKDGILLATGLHVHRNSAHSAGVGAIFDRVLTELVSKMRDMQMDKTELGCLRAIAYCKQKYPEQPGRFAKLLLRLPALRSIGLKCLEHLFFFKLIGDTPIDTFLMEMLEAPHQMT
ncbi:hypothetical protein CRUP_002068 [Coryphaenoides rupestris]|nr:hypothetical protein CRUP_002068 [Coryphaenoides rupestris]